MKSQLSLFLLFQTVCINVFADDAAPKSLDPEIKIELFAESPQIVTPTGIDVDHAGRVWAIESHTHFPPEGYSGHPTDRILVMQDTNGDGKADKIVTFTDGLTHTMSIAVKPLWLELTQGGKPKAESGKTQNTAFGSPLSAFVATRRDIFLFHDDNGDLQADRKERIIRLQTKGDYPHNGLAGFAFDAMGWMYFGFGENLGADYKIIGSDGTTLSGGGEGGNIYRCRPDGSKLKQWATGFWNPHASCMDAFGRLFTVDNDPDSRPPCRLLHIIEGGDYGYRFSNGRKGLHPFTSWNGEIPGTLPMVSGTGEAPSGVVAYESDGLPKKYIGNLLVTSWGDHRLDRFVLEPKGASFQSRPETIIQGDENFRPVGLAVAPDGSLYCTDWVSKEYKLHGRGRVWRISAKNEPKRKVIDAATITSKTPIKDLTKMLASSRLDVRRIASNVLTETQPGRKHLLKRIGEKKQPARERIEALWSLARVPIDSIKPGSIKPPRNYDEIALATLLLAESPQFPFNRNSQSSIFDLFDKMEFYYKNLPLADDYYDRFKLASFSLWPRNSREAISRFILPLLEDDVNSNDPFLFSALIYHSSKADIQSDQLESTLQSLTSKQAQSLYGFAECTNTRLAMLLLCRQIFASHKKISKLGLKDPAPNIRRAAVQWVAEENLTDLRPQVEAVLNSENMTTDLFLATLAALEMLDGKSPKDFDKTPPAKYVLPLLRDEKRSLAVRAQALRLVDADDPALDAKLFQNLLAVDDATLKLEAVRTLQHSSKKFVAGLLTSVAVDEKSPVDLRAEAVTGLYGRWFDAPNSSEITQSLTGLMKAKQPSLQLEAIRASRKLLVKTAQGRATRTSLLKSLKSALVKNPDALTQEGVHRRIAEQLVLAMSQSGIRLPDILKPILADRPKTNADWYQKVNADYFHQVVDGIGNVSAGRRIFFHADSAGCYKCHTVNGRGGNVGPDLSTIGRALNRKRLTESILEPSKEIAPQYTNWTFVMKSGKVHHGMILGDVRDDIQQVGTPEGQVINLKAREIEFRQPQKTSVMPEKLIDRMTVSEFRDLLAYLQSLK